MDGKPVVSVQDILFDFDWSRKSCEVVVVKGVRDAADLSLLALVGLKDEVGLA